MCLLHCLKVHSDFDTCSLAGDSDSEGPGIRRSPAPFGTSASSCRISYSAETSSGLIERGLFGRERNERMNHTRAPAAATMSMAAKKKRATTIPTTMRHVASRRPPDVRGIVKRMFILSIPSGSLDPTCAIHRSEVRDRHVTADGRDTNWIGRSGEVTARACAKGQHARLSSRP